MIPPNTENWREIQLFIPASFDCEWNKKFLLKATNIGKLSQTARTLWTGHPSATLPNFPRLIAALQNDPNKYARSLFPAGICNFSHFGPTLIKFRCRGEIVIGAMPEIMMNVAAFNQTEVRLPVLIISTCTGIIQDLYWNYPSEKQKVMSSKRGPPEKTRNCINCI